MKLGGNYALFPFTASFSAAILYYLGQGTRSISSKYCNSNWYRKSKENARPLNFTVKFS